MLSAQENEFLVRVGAGTPMGELLRRFWMPVLLSEELPERDSAPLRTRVLGENLVIFRDTDNNIGILDVHCPHRRASMFFGRNEECGLRCVYHGWKFDTEGNCVDMPSEPAESNFKDKVKIKSYPAEEYGDCIWIYMGPAELKPPLPDMELFRVPKENRVINRFWTESNFVQTIEGDLDTAHVSFLHKWFEHDPNPRLANGGRKKDGQQMNSIDSAPKLTVGEHDGGFIYGSRRTIGENEYYWRCTQFLLPVFTLIPSPSENAYGGHIWVPADDENTYIFPFSYHPDRPLTERERQRRIRDVDWETIKKVMPEGTIVDVRRDKKTLRNDFLIDRDMQRNRNYTGILEARTEDEAMTESMGNISDRTREHLGTSDTAIIFVRRQLARLARDLQEGQEPYAPSHPEVFHVRAIDAVSNEGEFAKFYEKEKHLAKAVV